jgi:hypothetical protein
VRFRPAWIADHCIPLHANWGSNGEGDRPGTQLCGARKDAVWVVEQALGTAGILADEAGGDVGRRRDRSSKRVQGPGGSW